MAPATSLQQHAHPATSLQLHKHRSAAALSTTPLKGDNADDALSTTRLRGDNADDYTTPVYIDGQGPFSLNVDTGSALVGVAGNETIGCDLYYDSSACDGGPIKVVYGSGFWSGVVCEATVTLVPPAIGPPRGTRDLGDTRGGGGTWRRANGCAAASTSTTLVAIIRLVRPVESK